MRDELPSNMSNETWVGIFLISVNHALFKIFEVGSTTGIVSPGEIGTGTTCSKGLDHMN